MTKHLGFFSFFRFEVLKIDRGAHPAWLTLETHAFPDFEHLKSEQGKNLGFFSFFRFEVLKSDRGAHPAWLTLETPCLSRF